MKCLNRSSTLLPLEDGTRLTILRSAQVSKRSSRRGAGIGAAFEEKSRQ
jgi:hypothetical protein